MGIPLSSCLPCPLLVCTKPAPWEDVVPLDTYSGPWKFILTRLFEIWCFELHYNFIRYKLQIKFTFPQEISAYLQTQGCVSSEMQLHIIFYIIYCMWLLGSQILDSLWNQLIWWESPKRQKAGPSLSLPNGLCFECLLFFILWGSFATSYFKFGFDTFR